VPHDPVTLLTASEVAQILRIPRLAVYRLIREGRLPAVRIGRLVRIPHDALQEWIRAGGSPLATREEIATGAPNTFPPHGGSRIIAS
jgi:excisionase family DNA binding protein